MGAWAAIIAGALKLANALAAALQQRHDEMAGKNAQVAQDNVERARAEHAAAEAMVGSDRDSVLKQLRDGSA